jgi:hypothetical protein
VENIQKIASPMLPRNVVSVESLISKRSVVAGAVVLTSLLGPARVSAVASTVSSLRTTEINSQEVKQSPDVKLDPIKIMLRRALLTAADCFVEHSQGASTFSQACSAGGNTPKPNTPPSAG